LRGGITFSATQEIWKDYCYTLHGRSGENNLVQGRNNIECQGKDGGLEKPGGPGNGRMRWEDCRLFHAASGLPAPKVKIVFNQP
jgi:hypothetical protein